MQKGGLSSKTVNVFASQSILKACIFDSLLYLHVCIYTCRYLLRMLTH